MAHLRTEVETVFRGVFADEHLILNENMTAADVGGWDSLMHINLVIALEKHFGVRFATAEIARLKEAGQNVGTLMRLLAVKLAARTVR